MKTTERPLTDRFAETHLSFRAKIQAIADKAQMTPLDVYAMWLEYADQCTTCDQSALIEEFREWYADRLIPKPEPLSERDELLSMLKSALAYIEGTFCAGGLDDDTEEISGSVDYGPEVTFAFGDARRLVERLRCDDDPRSTCAACNAVSDGPVPAYCSEHDGDYSSFLAMHNCD